MILNHFKTTIRNFRKHSFISLVNIFGLTLGISCSLLIFIYVNEQTSFDQYQKDADRVFRVVEEIKSPSSVRGFAQVAWPVAPTLRKDFPEVETATRISTYWNTKVVKYRNKTFFEKKFAYADQSFFKIFTVNFVAGNPATALKSPNSLVLVKSVAEKYFGTENPLGKSIQLNNTSYQVTGVVDDLPFNTHFKFELIGSLKTIEDSRWVSMSNWMGTECFTYIKLRPNVDVENFKEKVRRLANPYAMDKMKSSGYTISFLLQPITSIHLKSNLNAEHAPPGNLNQIIIFTLIGLLVLLIAALNYVNLTTDMSVNRAREIGLRKVLGGMRKNIIHQIYLESSLLVLIALILAVWISLLTMPLVNRLFGTHFGFSTLLQGNILMGLLLIGLLVGIGAGTYPALVISGFQPSVALKSSFRTQRHSRKRKAMAVFQFSLSILLMICTLTIHKQINHMQKTDMGFKKAQQLIIPLLGGASLGENYAGIKHAFLKNPDIESVAATSDVLSEKLSTFNVKTIDDSLNYNNSMNHFFVNPDFIPTYEIELLAGRNFSEELIATDRTEWSKPTVFIINEAAAKSFGFSDPEDALGLGIISGLGNLKGKIIGVVRDFNYRGLQSKVEPLLLEWFPTRLRYLTVNINTQNLSETTGFIQNTFKEFFPGAFMRSYFLDEKFNLEYQSEKQTFQLTAIFSIVGILIAGIGLFGLAFFHVEGKRKEISIRKVLGCSTQTVITNLGREFVRWLFWSNLIAWPIAYLVLKMWLSKFAYKSPLSFELFLFSGILSLLLVVMSVGYQSITAARKNPIEYLRES